MTVAGCLAVAPTVAPAAAQAPAEPAKPAAPTPPAAGGTPDNVPFGRPCGAPIGFGQARAILAVTEAEATKRGWPMNIAVVDTHGDLVQFARMDGAQLASIGIAQSRGRTAARWRRESRVFDGGYADGGTYFANPRSGSRRVARRHRRPGRVDLRNRCRLPEVRRGSSAVR